MFWVFFHVYTGARTSHKLSVGIVDTESAALLAVTRLNDKYGLTVGESDKFYDYQGIHHYKDGLALVRGWTDGENSCTS